MAEPSDDVRSLYREPPDRFIAARDDLVARLKAENRPDEAASVKRLKKPTVPAWALNQLSSHDAPSVQALLDAGSEIRAAQQAALSTGGRAARLREAVAARRSAVVKLSNVAANILRQADRAAGAHVDDVAAALEVAAVDDEAGERLRTGTFERPPAGATGFGDLVGLRSIPGGGGSDDEDDGTAAGTARDEPRDRQGTPRSRSPLDRAERERSRAEMRRLEHERDATRRRAKRAREALARATERVASAEAELGRARERLADAEATARAAELDERRADEALRSANENR